MTKGKEHAMLNILLKILLDFVAQEAVNFVL
jgi:hypothetical protein